MSDLSSDPGEWPVMIGEWEIEGAIDPQKLWESRLVTLQTYTLELLGPSKAIGPAHGTRFAERVLRETEENLTDLLPEGYSVRIREWDAEEETPNERS